VYEIANNLIGNITDDIDLSLLSDPLLFGNSQSVVEEFCKKTIKTTLQNDTNNGNMVQKKIPEKVQNKIPEKVQNKIPEKVLEKVQNKIPEKVLEKVLELSIDESFISDIHKEIQKTLKDGIFTKHNREKFHYSLMKQMKVLSR
jgi:ribosomal protein L16 Arg81 hydroxylase